VWRWGGGGACPHTLPNAGRFLCLATPPQASAEALLALLRSPGLTASAQVDASAQLSALHAARDLLTPSGALDEPPDAALALGMLRGGVPSWIAAVLQSAPTPRADVCIAALGVLARLAVVPECCSGLLQVVPAVLGALSAHERALEVVEAGLGFLAALSLHDGTEVSATRVGVGLRCPGPSQFCTMVCMVSRRLHAAGEGTCGCALALGRQARRTPRGT
jgi:hypothetical protein